MSDRRYRVAVLLPTRGRTGALESSLRSLIDLAQDLGQVQFLLGFDRDDDLGKTYFMNSIRPWMVERGVNYRALVFDPMGYARLNEYVNRLAGQSDADWLFFWNDDAVMQTQAWDDLISQHTGQFQLLSVRTHRDHPYSIFPIAPREWFDALDGCLSPHNLTDAWLSQQAYMLDILRRIDVHVLHDRFDLTGNNNDATYQEREVFEGNPSNPRDFHHVDWTQRRLADTERLAQYMRGRGLDTAWWDSVRSGTQDPWQKLKENDTNGQMVQYKLDSTGRQVSSDNDQMYGFDYFFKADGINSWRSRSLKFGDALAGLSYAHGVTWDEMMAAWPQVFEHDANGRGESMNQSLVHQQMEWLDRTARRRPQRVLEIGGGRGEVATVLKHMGIDVVSVEMGAGAHKWYHTTAYHYFGEKFQPVVPVNLPIQQALANLDLSTFDTILMVESLEHIPQEAFDPVWQAICQQFRGRFIVVNWPDYHPIWVGRDASPEEHCRLVDDALYDDWSRQAQSVWTRRGSHLVLDFE